MVYIGNSLKNLTWSLHLQKCLYLNVHTYPVWFLVVAFFFYDRYYAVSHLVRILSSAVLLATALIEIIRLFLGYSGNISYQVPELAGFLMLTVLMQVPLISYFLFNPFLLSTPIEVMLHCVIWIMLLVEAICGYFTFKEASDRAKAKYFAGKSLSDEKVD